MRAYSTIAAACLALMVNSGVARAQVPSIPDLSGTPNMPGGLSGLAGGVPDLSSMGAGNAAGILGYCIKNKILGAGGAGSVLSGLTRKPGLTSSPDYAAGQAGNLDLGGGSGLSMSNLQGRVKTKVCDLVLKNAKNLL